MGCSILSGLALSPLLRKTHVRAPGKMQPYMQQADNFMLEHFRVYTALLLYFEIAQMLRQLFRDSPHPASALP